MILVFGAAGFVGRSLVHRLLEEDAEFLASDLIGSPFPADSNVPYIRANLLDPYTVGKVVEEADIVIHLAASSLQTSLEWPWMNMKVNVEGTMNVLEACRQRDTSKLVFSSASSVIGEPRYNPVDEEHSCYPTTPYAASKLCCEHYVEVYGRLYDLKYLTYRFFNVYGPGQEEGAVPAIHRALSTQSTFNIHGDGSAVRDYVYVGDVVDFLLEAVRSPVGNELVNLGTGIPMSTLELVNLASEILGVKPKLNYVLERSGEIGNFYADTAKLLRLFGRKPETTLREGLKQTLKCQRKVGEG